MVLRSVRRECDLKIYGVSSYLLPFLDPERFGMNLIIYKCRNVPNPVLNQCSEIPYFLTSVLRVRFPFGIAFAFSFVGLESGLGDWVVYL